MGTIISFNCMSLGIFSKSEKADDEFKRGTVTICAVTCCDLLELKENNILLIRTAEVSTAQTDFT